MSGVEVGWSGILNGSLKLLREEKVPSVGAVKGKLVYRTRFSFAILILNIVGEI